MRLVATCIFEVEGAESPREMRQAIAEVVKNVFSSGPVRTEKGLGVTIKLSNGFETARDD